MTYRPIYFKIQIILFVSFFTLVFTTTINTIVKSTLITWFLFFFQDECVNWECILITAGSWRSTTAHSWSAVLADMAFLSLPSCRLVKYFFMILNLVYWYFKMFLKVFLNSLSKIIDHKKSALILNKLKMWKTKNECNTSIPQGWSFNL